VTKALFKGKRLQSDTRTLETLQKKRATRHRTSIDTGQGSFTLRAVTAEGSMMKCKLKLTKRNSKLNAEKEQVVGTH
jgi:hypothetical protein